MGGTQQDSIRVSQVWDAPVRLFHWINFVSVTLILHIAAVILADKRQGGAIISAMFTGRKYLSGKPLDAGKPDWKTNSPTPLAGAPLTP